MKKHLFIILLALLTITVNAQTKRVAILKVVDKENNVPENIKLVLRKSLTSSITNISGYAAFDRVNAAAIIDEQAFQRSGHVSEESIKKLGEMAGADYILIAEAAMFDESTCSISAKMLNVETGMVEHSAPSKTCSLNNQSVEAVSKQIANKLLGVKMNYSQNAQELYKKGVEALQGGEFFDMSGIKHINETMLTHAFECFKTAAELNHSGAMAGLSVCYLKGYGTDINYPMAFKYASQSANLNNTEGLYLLGECYANGFGVGPNLNNAIELFKQAAEKGLVQAQFALGEQYESRREFYNAKMWYNKAYKQGYPGAKEAIDRVQIEIDRIWKDFSDSMEKLGNAIEKNKKK